MHNDDYRYNDYRYEPNIPGHVYVDHLKRVPDHAIVLCLDNRFRVRSFPPHADNDKKYHTREDAVAAIIEREKSKG